MIPWIQTISFQCLNDIVTVWWGSMTKNVDYCILRLLAANNIHDMIWYYGLCDDSILLTDFNNHILFT